jgi:hypothetical protein
MCKVQTNIYSYKFARLKAFLSLALKLYGLYMSVCVN